MGSKEGGRDEDRDVGHVEGETSGGKDREREMWREREGTESGLVYELAVRSRAA